MRLKKVGDYAEVTSKLEPVINVARNLGCFILFIHRAPKMERELVDSALGSTGFVGSVDTAILIKKDKNGTRSFSTIQRYRNPGEKDVEDMVIDLAADGITLEPVGSIHDVKMCNRSKSRIKEVRKK